jgi:hypothetical protein
MLVTIKNTFIDVIEIESPSTHFRPRSRSLHCDHVNEIYLSAEDSVSTAPSTCSPTVGPRLANTPVILTGVGPGFTLISLKKRLMDGGLIDYVAQLELLTSETEHQTCVSVTLNNPDYAMSLFQLLHGEDLDGCIVTVNIDRVEGHPLPSATQDISRRGAVATTKLFIGGLKPSTHSRSLREFMQRYGPVKDCGVVYDFKGVSKRFGYCEYWSEESVLSVLDTGQHYIDSQAVGIRPYKLRA